LNLLEVSEAEVAALKEQATLANTDTFTRILEVFADTELRLRDAASKKIMVEVALLKAIEARNALPIDAVLKQLNQLRSGADASAASNPSAAASAGRPTAKPLTSHQEIAAPAAMAEMAPVSADLTELWKKLGDAVTHASRFVGSYLINARIVSFEKNLLTIGFDPEFEDQLGLVDNARNHTLLQTKLAELGHPHCHVKFVKAEAPANRRQIAQDISREEREVSGEKITPQPSPSSRPSRDVPAAKEKAPVAFNKNDFKNDPLIQKALEIFKGQIVEVRA
jgi:DNA polymerase-3 subunit gamma/tau